MNYEFILKDRDLVELALGHPVTKEFKGGTMIVRYVPDDDETTEMQNEFIKRFFEEEGMS